jgi:hypothetical protein
MTNWTQLSAVNKHMREEASVRVNRRLLEKALLKARSESRVENCKLLSILWTLVRRRVIVTRSPSDLFPTDILYRHPYLSPIVNPTRDTVWNPWSAWIIQHRGEEFNLKDVQPERFEDMVNDALEAGFPPRILCQLILSTKQSDWVLSSWSNLAFILIAHECPIDDFTSLFTDNPWMAGPDHPAVSVYESPLSGLERFKRAPPTPHYMKLFSARVVEPGQVQRWAVGCLRAVPVWNDKHLELASWLRPAPIGYHPTHLITEVVRRVPKSEHSKFVCLAPYYLTQAYSPRMSDSDVSEVLFPDNWYDVGPLCRILVLIESKKAPVPAVHLDRILPKEDRLGSVMHLLKFYFRPSQLVDGVPPIGPWIDLANNLRRLGLDLPRAVREWDTDLPEQLKAAMQENANDSEFERFLEEGLSRLPVF